MPLPEEVVVLLVAVIERLGEQGRPLAQQIELAVPADRSTTMLDVEVPEAAPRADLPDGSLPIGVTVRRGGAVTGELLIWLSDGRLAAIEQSWLTDDLPMEWPRLDEVEIDV